MIIVENLGGSSSYDAIVDAWIPGGCIGCEPPGVPTPLSFLSPHGLPTVGNFPGFTTWGSMDSAPASPQPICRETSGGTAQPDPMTLHAGDSFDIYCHVESGKTYQFTIRYDTTGPTPGDTGNFVGLKLYDGAGGWVADSASDGYKLESISNTANSNDVWRIHVENLATSPTYDTGVDVDVWIPGGCIGCYPNPTPPPQMTP